MENLNKSTDEDMMNDKAREAFIAQRKSLSAEGIEMQTVFSKSGTAQSPKRFSVSEKEQIRHDSDSGNLRIENVE